MVVDNQEGRVSRMRTAKTISFKIDVCNYLIRANNNVTATAKHFNLLRKQVRYYTSRHEIYIAFSNKAGKKNLVQVSASRKRAKYCDQEKMLFEWIMLSREEGNLFYFR